MENAHFEKLTCLYHSANINQHHFLNSKLVVEFGKTCLETEIGSAWHHGAGSVHGAVLFKMLDDAAFFAAQSVEKEKFILTSHFQIQFNRPVESGLISAFGVLRSVSKNLLVAESRIVNEKGKELAFGTGNFLKSQILLENIAAYRG
jgi:uncharacterized protein (TIGR00369 family)